MAEIDKNDAILPEHASHPGWDFDGCIHRITVTPRYGAAVSPGFACALSGGHCLGCDEFTTEEVD